MAEPVTVYHSTGRSGGLRIKLGNQVLESRLEEQGVLRCFSRPRISNDNPYSESLFHTLKYRPDYPRGHSRAWQRLAAG